MPVQRRQSVKFSAFGHYGRGSSAPLEVGSTEKVGEGAEEAVEGDNYGN